MGRIIDIVYWGHRRDHFGPVFGANLDLLEVLRDFVLDERWLDTSSQWIMERSVLELGRYSKYPGTANYDRLPAIVSAVRNEYASGVRGESVWLRLVAEIDYNDPDSCTRYDLCAWYGGEGFHANFRAVLFDDTLECPMAACPAESISIQSQDLRPEELQLACRRLHDHGGYFQELFDTGCVPVRDDVNSRLEIFVFSDGRSCEDLESGAFGRFPDACSGIYYEGDPSSTDTVAQMIATEYTADENPADPELAIWNFEHEFGHYLDGRYNRYGGYRGGIDSIHWWTEGFAEFFAEQTSPYIGLPRFESPYSLTDTMLHSDSIPTRYRHRHLAVRFVMSRHRAFIDELLGFMRRGEYDAYTSHIRSEAPKYETEWQQWLAEGPPR